MNYVLVASWIKDWQLKKEREITSALEADFASRVDPLHNLARLTVLRELVREIEYEAKKQETR